MKIILLLAALMNLGPNESRTKSDRPQVVESVTYKKSLDICKEVSNDKKSLSNESETNNMKSVLIF